MESNTEKKGLFARLKEGLGKTRNSFNEKIDNVFSVFQSLTKSFMKNWRKR